MFRWVVEHIRRQSGECDRVPAQPREGVTPGAQYCTGFGH
jgi:hypothetical protein